MSLEVFLYARIKEVLMIKPNNPMFNLPQEDETIYLDISSDLDISDYIKEKIYTSSYQKQKTRRDLTLLLFKFLGFSVVGTFLLAFVAVFYPGMDKSFILEITDRLLDFQGPLIAGVIAFYFATKGD